MRKGDEHRILTQAAQAAVKKKGSHFQTVFRRLLPGLKYKGAIWAIAHRLGRLLWKLLHDGISYVEQGRETHPKVKKRRAQKLLRLMDLSHLMETIRQPPSVTNHSIEVRAPL